MEMEKFWKNILKEYDEYKAVNSTQKLYKVR